MYDRIYPVLRNGRIYAAWATSCYHEPTLVTNYYPTCYGRDMLPEDGSLADVQFDRRLEDIRFHRYGRWLPTGIAGNTQCEIQEVTPIPCPKVRNGIETRWYDGRWQKRMASGWKDA